MYKKLFLIAILTLFLFLSGCTETSIEEPSAMPQDRVVQSTPPVETPGQIYARAISTNNFNLCGQTNKQEECILEIAVKTKDWNGCKVISPSQETKDKCIMKEAASTGDWNTCFANVKTESVLVDCIKATKDWNRCNGLASQESKDKCTMELAIANNDPNTCNVHIKTASVKEECLAAFK